ncbi:MAG: SPFH/Band 7/PHB domain protein [Moraxellaceae bacterium]|nr:SPFH/Band 7/PHB domain protein [Moraxellaceae bacterium]
MKFIIGIILAIIFFGILVWAYTLTGVQKVDQGYNFIVQRLGKYHRTLEPGLNFIVPFLDRVVAEMDIKETMIDIPPQEVITRDNVTITANAMAYVQVVRPDKAMYAIDDYQEAICSLVQTSLRSILGEMEFDNALSNRELIKEKLKKSISDEIKAWGIALRTVEIQDINPSESMKLSMEKQAAAERERRATVTRAEGEREAQILEAKGKLEASKLIAESQKVLAKGTEASISSIASAVGEHESPIVYLLGEQYIKAMQDMAESDNAKTVVLPSDILNTVKGLTGGKGGKS